jgi:hypothetical protein
VAQRPITSMLAAKHAGLLRLFSTIYTAYCVSNFSTSKNARNSYRFFKTHWSQSREFNRIMTVDDG